MKDWHFKRRLKSSNVCVDLYTTRISDFVFHRRRCQFPNSLLLSLRRQERLEHMILSRGICSVRSHGKMLPRQSEALFS